MVLASFTMNISAAEETKKDTGAIETPAADTLTELLNLVKNDKIRQSKTNAKRVEVFRNSSKSATCFIESSKSRAKT